MKKQQAHVLKIGTLEVSTENCTIAVDGRVTKVSPRSMDVLVHLTEHAERVVSAEELLDRFWSSLASDHAVHKAIAELRAAMGDSVRHQRHIKTVPKRGYKLLVPARNEDPEEPPAAAAIMMQVRQRSRLPGWRQIVCSVVFILAAAGLGVLVEMKRGGGASALVLDMAPLCFASTDAQGKRYLLIVGLVQADEGSQAYPQQLNLRHGDTMDPRDVMACDISGVLVPRLDATGG